VVVAEIRRWIGTPYHHGSDVLGAGVDCGMSLVRAFVDAGVIAGVRPKALSARLDAAPGRGALPRPGQRFAAREFDPAAAAPGAGDVVVWRHGRTFSHGGVVTGAPGTLSGWPWVTHAYARRGPGRGGRRHPRPRPDAAGRRPSPDARILLLGLSDGLRPQPEVQAHLHGPAAQHGELDPARGADRRRQPHGRQPLGLRRLPGPQAEAEVREGLRRLVDQLHLFGLADPGPLRRRGRRHRQGLAGQGRGSDYSTLGFSLFTGTMPQAPWGYMVAAHPDHARGYPGFAYLAKANMDFGSSATMPNLNFEVFGLFYMTAAGGALPDADPALWIQDFLTDTDHGVGLPGRHARCGRAALLGGCDDDRRLGVPDLVPGHGLRHLADHGRAGGRRRARSSAGARPPTPPRSGPAIR
jgi:hypothetical protein